jgi:predicted NBD/HSP70 family sugar kinase/predicted transcriptional regulator
MMAPRQRLKPVRSTEIRRSNERLLLSLLHDGGPQTQTDLVTLTGLQASTIFRIFADLEERGIIQEVESQVQEKVRKGRRPSFYALYPAAGYAVGVDLATGHAAVVLVDFSGQVVASSTVRFDVELDGNSAIRQIIETIRDVMKRVGVDYSALIGAGIGAPGIVDIETGAVVYYSRFPGMEGTPIRDVIQGELGIPVYVHNNASVLALSEHRYGRAQGVKSLAAFLLRGGVGGAYVNNGSIFTSQGRTTFEVGHLFLDISSISLEADAEHSVEDCLSEAALVRHISTVSPSCNTIEEVIRALETHEPRVCQALATRAEVFVHVVRNIALLLNPEAFLIITRFKSLSEYFAEYLEKRRKELPGAERFNIGSVIAVEYDPIIACKGAAHLVFDAYFRNTAATL